MRQSVVSRTVQIAFASAIAILLLVGGFSYRGIRLSAESDRLVWHTHQVLAAVDKLRLTMESVTANARGFVLTGQKSYLDAYHVNKLTAGQAQARISELTLDDPQQQRQLSILAGLVTRRFERADRLIELYKTGGLETTAQHLRLDASQQSIDQVRHAVGGIADTELALLVLRDAQAKRRLRQTKTVLLAGTVIGVLIAAAAGLFVRRENSRRRSVELALGDSEESYRMLLDGVQGYAIFMLDPAGTVLSWNVGAERIKGYTAEQIIGQNFSCFFPPEDVARGWPAEVLRMATASGYYEEQSLRVRRDGSRFLANVTLAALRDPEGMLRGFSEISHDITQREESAAKYRGLLEAAPDAMVVVNQGGEIVLLNVQAEKQFGYSRDELVGQKVTNIIPQGFAERLIADALRTADEALTQEIGAGLELRGRRKNGSKFPIEIMLSPLKSADGILVTAAIRDITTRKKAEAHLLIEAQLVEKMDELKRSNEELAQFAYIASHDLQEPLRMVASYTQLLSKRYKGKLDSDADDFIAFAVDGANRMQRLIQDLLAYSRVGTRSDVLVDTSSEGALEEALLNLGGAIEESGAVVTHDPLPPVLADESQLVQLFQNLVSNGIKYRSSEVPHVHVSAVKDREARWRFAVKDNGLGIDPQYFERIFGMFQRLHKREDFAGTGIGLAICKKIVERHGGSISVESQPGRGSTFHFALAGSESAS